MDKIISAISDKASSAVADLDLGAAVGAAKDAASDCGASKVFVNLGWGWMKLDEVGWNLVFQWLEGLSSFAARRSRQSKVFANPAFKSPLNGWKTRF